MVNLGGTPQQQAAAYHIQALREENIRSRERSWDNRSDEAMLPSGKSRASVLSSTRSSSAGCEARGLAYSSPPKAGVPLLPRGAKNTSPPPAHRGGAAGAAPAAGACGLVACAGIASSARASRTSVPMTICNQAQQQQPLQHQRPQQLGAPRCEKSPPPHRSTSGATAAAPPVIMCTGTGSLALQPCGPTGAALHAIGVGAPC